LATPAIKRYRRPIGSGLAIRRLCQVLALAGIGFTAACDSQGAKVAAHMPSVTPKIVFSAAPPPLFGEIYRVGLDGRLTDLSRSPADDAKPAVSPDGRWLARATGPVMNSSTWFAVTGTA
jgi:WD40 repeat protein